MKKNSSNSRPKFLTFSDVVSQRKRITSELNEIFKLYPELELRNSYDCEDDSNFAEFTEQDFRGYYLNLLTALDHLGHSCNLDEIVREAKRPILLSKKLDFELSESDLITLKLDESYRKYALWIFIEHERKIYALLNNLYHDKN